MYTKTYIHVHKVKLNIFCINGQIEQKTRILGLTWRVGVIPNSRPVQKKINFQCCWNWLMLEDKKETRFWCYSEFIDKCARYMSFDVERVVINRRNLNVPNFQLTRNKTNSIHMDFLPTNTSQFYPIYYSTGQSEHLVCQHKTGRMFLATPKPTIEIWFSSAEKPRLGSIKYCDDRHKIFLESLNQYRIKKKPFDEHLLCDIEKNLNKYRSHLSLSFSSILFLTLRFAAWAKSLPCGTNHICALFWPLFLSLSWLDDIRSENMAVVCEMNAKHYIDVVFSLLYICIAKHFAIYTYTRTMNKDNNGRMW